MNEKAPIQEAQEKLEEARLAQIQQLTDEENKTKESLAAMRREVTNFNTERSNATAKLRFKEAEKISEKIAAIQPQIRQAEEVLKGLKVKQENARQCRTPELAPLQRKVDLAMTAERQSMAKKAEEHFLSLITDEIRAAAMELAHRSNDTHASVIALHALNL